MTLDDLKIAVTELKKDVQRIVNIVNSNKEAQVKINEIGAIVNDIDTSVEAADPEQPPA